MDVAAALGVHVHHLVGDLDSADPAAIDAAVAAGITVDRHPAEKDATDLELAFAAAIQRGRRFSPAGASRPIAGPPASRWRVVATHR